MSVQGADADFWSTRILSGTAGSRPMMSTSVWTLGPLGAALAVPRDPSGRRAIYCSFNYLHRGTIWRMLQRARSELRRQSAVSAPLIMLAHSKSFYSYRNFDRLLTRLGRVEDVRFVTTRDAVRAVADQLQSPSAA